MDTEPHEPSLAETLAVRLVLRRLTGAAANEADRHDQKASRSRLAQGARVTAWDLSFFSDSELDPIGAVVTVMLGIRTLATLTLQAVRTTSGAPVGLVMAYAFDPTCDVVKQSSRLQICVPRTSMAVVQEHTVEHASGSLLLTGASLGQLEGREVAVRPCAEDVETNFGGVDWRGYGYVVLVP